VFHGHGRAYDTIHDVYYVLLIGLLGFALVARGNARRGRMGGGPMGPGSAGPGQQRPPLGGYGAPTGWSQQAPQPAAQTPQTAAPPAGWYTEPGNPDHERYWDGRAWGPLRHRQNGTWVDEA
jgi:hypothetical protein